MQQVFASIITIGDELLIGQVTDTNSPWMAQELNKTGIWLKRRVAVGDLKEEIVHALDEQSKDCQIIIMTGGLGPTADDITKQVLNDYFGGNMVTDQRTLEHIRYLFEKVYRRPIIQRNLEQADVPDVCTVLFNERGSAPGMWFERDGRVFVSLPGVPHEMKGLMLKEVLPRLQQHFTMPFISHRTLLTAGVGESFLAEMIKDWEAQLPPHIKLAYLPHYSMVRLRITGSGASKEKLENDLDQQFAQLKQLVAEHMVVDEDKPLQQVVGDLLKQRHKTMATAESCTGGYIAHLITSIAGSSDYFKGTVVSYANEVKENVLKVSHDTLIQDGAVSESTVRQMVQGALITLNTDFAVATSGIMGPGGGSETKPVGTVWIAAGNKDEIVTQLFHFRFDRARNIEMAAINALNLLRKFIASH
ncbi:CinA family nicotinamide mononucleotide deamidase-related protein [Pseudobacter ginsenosidimutans]|uniref:CinA-like protein n=1 Tax=Pseudobacter ginsenosidimutans TaxID=661488 RepID=A0A4V2EZL7_9BACT|nr:CinA family nicotinamide mononucleotide deamidase-related protein [Pseudobacter ginsenosidimutans]QEC45402.1 CinA family nicotinamide mononucleotide deamidase-related protein [Pseudobacter ginsenosidimutans]RZS66930.1 competence/damage-inducible protein cinA [Pseudobacter ginsenosidimutans]